MKWEIKIKSSLMHMKLIKKCKLFFFKEKMHESSIIYVYDSCSAKYVNKVFAFSEVILIYLLIHILLCEVFQWPGTLVFSFLKTISITIKS